MLFAKFRWSTLPFFAKNLIISFGSITLIGIILITAAYQLQKSILVEQLHDQATVITEKWYNDLDTGKVAEAVNEKVIPVPYNRNLERIWTPSMSFIQTSRKRTFSVRNWSKVTARPLLRFLPICWSPLRRAIWPQAPCTLFPKITSLSWNK